MLKDNNKFNLAYKKKETIKINEIELVFIGIDELLQDKASNPRHKNLEDINQLKAIKKK